jgi:hypothetical protein
LEEFRSKQTLSLEREERETGVKGRGGRGVCSCCHLRKE